MSAVTDLAANGWPVAEWTVSDWAVVARSVSAGLAASAARRERDAAPPGAQLGTLAETGLVNLLIPAGSGGAGGTWRDAAWTVREVTSGDGAVGALLASHYLAASLAALSLPAGPAHSGGAGLLARSARGRWLWTGLHGAGLEASPAAGGGLIVTGTQPGIVATALADVATVVARRTDRPGLVFAVVPADREGLAIRPDHERLGLRLATATAEATGLRVEPDEILGEGEGEALPALFEPIAAVLRAAVFLGSAWGAFARARDYTLTREPRRFARGLASSDSGASKDIPTLARTGQIWALLQAGQAALGAAADAADAAWPRRADLTTAEARALAGRTALAAAYNQEVALSTTQSVYDISGTAATANTFGFDRHWRDARTLAQHHPLAVAYTAAGADFLTQPA